MKCCIVFYLSFAIYTSSGAPSTPLKSDEESLVLLHVLFRHGNRTPDKSSLFPNDLYLNYTYEPYGYSQLTLKGKRTEYAIGKYLRENYNNFIPKQYVPDVVDALSTNFKRTKMSLELVLAGLFPPLASEKIEVGLNWQPVPYNIETTTNLITPALYACPLFILAYSQYTSGPESQATLNKYRDILNQLANYIGKDVNSFADVQNLYVVLKSEEDFGLKLPEWSKDFYPKLLEELSGIEYERATATPTLKKLSTGFLLKKILDDSYAVQNGTLAKDTKVFLYSAHEFTVGTMLNALNVFYRHVPPFGATIFFEIHRINGQYGLKLFYQDYSAVKPKLLTIPGCNSFCPLDQLVSLVADSVPSEQNICSISGEMF